MAFSAGKSFSITIAGTAKPLSKIEVTIDGEKVDVTNFTSLGWQELLLGCGIKSVEITGTGPYNGLASAAAASDAVGTNVSVICTWASISIALTIPCQLLNVGLPVDVRGAAEISYKLASTGVPTIAY